MQLLYDLGTSKLIDPIMESLHLPMTLSEAGISFTEEQLTRLIKTIIPSSYTKDRTYDVERLRQVLRSIW